MSLPTHGLTPESQPISRTPEHRLYDVDPDNMADVAAAAALHRQLFADIGLIAQLGDRVLRRICYQLFVRDGVMGASVFEVEGHPAGLVAYTTDSKAVHEAAGSKYSGAVIREFLISLALEPSIVFKIPGAVRLLLERHNERVEGDVPVAEMLAIGVLPPYRTVEFVRQTGLRIPDRLLTRALQYFRHAGVREARGVVLADNLPALAFFRMRASRIEPFPNASKRSYQMWFDVEKPVGLRAPNASGTTSGSTQAQH